MLPDNDALKALLAASTPVPWQREIQTTADGYGRACGPDAAIPSDDAKMLAVLTRLDKDAQLIALAPWMAEEVIHLLHHHNFLLYLRIHQFHYYIHLHLRHLHHQNKYQLIQKHHWHLYHKNLCVDFQQHQNQLHFHFHFLFHFHFHFLFRKTLLP
jgi:hypothetical protein